MKKILLFVFLLLAGKAAYAKAADTVFVHETQIPVLIERQDNVLFKMRIEAGAGKRLDEVILNFGKEVKLSDIRSVKLYYGGTEALQNYAKKPFAPVDYVSAFAVGNTLAANLSYSILKAQVDEPGSRVVLATEQTLFPGINYFWVSLQMKPQATLLNKVTAAIASVKVDGKQAPIQMATPEGIVHRMGVGVRHAGDDGSAAFRIPGLATTNNGTLLGVYDVRYNNSADLQEHVDVGLSRSTDGGRTWEKMRLPLAFGETGGLPAAQNGVGDPSILVDTRTNTVWVVAAWTHGMGNQRAWWSSHPGMDRSRTAQLVMAKSTDDGKTWSEPINITEQVKDPSWYFLLQGPGRGITMQDGTLVFPIQYIDSTRVPNAGIMYSKDRGNTWTIHNHARTNTTEAQVAEVAPGVLMLNMRDNRGGSRAVSVTEDLGRTWTEHPSSRKALDEPVCMASLISVKAKDNVLGKDLLLFSNPNTKKERHHITIKASLDGGLTWLPENQLLLDEGESWGYSCLTMIDKETVGILYESSVAHMAFQSVKLTDIIKKK
ncbi:MULTISPECIES: BNR-repeat neuraminidase N-terminal domain-containing protein [unclassified Bacteroides]|uniref:BNR-repeat neuraminidase N-terminal domain-containing protein n=1 Tax=unclassified Bacteroides TaxID=2646097 RepID=UPI0040631144